MQFDQWLQENEANFDSPYEKEFAVNILAHIRGLDPRAVSTQFSFIDLDGKKRRCDFTIVEGDIRIAIEIDGYDKRNRGDGMTHREFIDWQRRQAALTSQGWHVLRFANRDVRHEPDRCRRYVTLLLNQQRKQKHHLASLHADVEKLKADLLKAQTNLADTQRTQDLQGKLRQLEQQYETARQTADLSRAEREELNNFLKDLQQDNQELVKATHNLSAEKQALGMENTKMKSLAWAFVALVALLGAGAIYLLERQPAQQPTQIVVQLPETAASGLEASSTHVATVPAQASVPMQSPTPSQPQIGTQPANNVYAIRSMCDTAKPWHEANQYIGQQMAYIGTVAGYSVQDNSRGAPTWINLGANYPDPNRLSAVVWKSDRAKFGKALSPALEGRQVCVIGTVRLYQGVPNLTLENPANLVFQ